MNWMFSLMGPRWWACLAVAAAFVFVHRTSSVGAPAEAGDRGAAAPISPLIANRGLLQGSSFAELPMEDELESLRRALRAEQERSALLVQEREVLQRQFDALSELAVDVLEGHAASRGEAPTVPDLAPVPIEAIYVHPGASR
ncbi:MAG: hypothetical protein VX460_03670 [Planctomycetota bacterium]|nr:hypothetical protein [Planctomycetota bacterium]